MTTIDQVKVIKAQIRTVLETQRISYRIQKFKICPIDKNWMSFMITGSSGTGEGLWALSMVRVAGDSTN